MESNDFGLKLKELRKLAGLSQRQLADMIGVNFSYLSKIESGKMPPPSEQIIIRLAEVLDTDRDELLTLAGKIPSDIAQILKSREALEILRSERTQKKINRFNKKEGTGIMSNLLNYKRLSKLAVPIVLVCAVAASLWFAAPLPARALQIEITNSDGSAAPTSGTLGSTYTFRVKISIEDNELLPINNINIEIYNVSNNSTYYDLYTNLALNATDYLSYSTSGTGSSASIKSTPDSMWEYFSPSTGYAGYAVWLAYGYHFPSVLGGYGYQTGPLAGTTSITYDITWTPPSSWPEGNYRIEAKITAQDNKTFTQTSSAISLSAPAAPPVGGGGGGSVTREVIETSPGVFDITAVLYTSGAFRQDVTLVSKDGKVKIEIDKYTVGKTRDNFNLTEISLTKMTDPPAPPEGKTIIGLTYDLKPDGATFSPAITLTFTYDPDDIPDGVDEEEMVIAIWVEDDDDTGEWVELENCVVHPVTHTITAPLNHFSLFAIIAPLPPVEEEMPAAFTVSDLSVSPAEVNIGDSVSISIMVTNTGDLSGSYDVSLKINSVVVETKSITLAGGASQTVSFTTTQDIAGTYTVTIDSQTGTFTVKTAPKAAAFTVSNLNISPARVESGESVSISVMVANTGDLSGSYDVSLEINGTTVETKSITLAGGASETVTFTTTQDITGTYTINVDTLSGSFTVMEAQPTGIAWWVWVIIGVAVIIVGALIYFVWWRQRYAY